MAAVIIGIGGVSKVVLMKMRGMIVEEYGYLKKDDLEFLHIDTFASPYQEPGQDFVTEVLGVDILLNPTERVVLSDGLPEPPDGAQLVRHPNVKQWFPETLPVNVDFAQGAGGVRPYGRLAFHHNVSEFMTRLNTKLGNISGERRDIYIVCSFFGGTGSGSFLDICYVASDVKNRLGARGEMHGFFLVGATDPTSVMQSNCYAALMEFEYYATKGVLHDLKAEERRALGFKADDDLKPFEARFPVTGVPPVVSSEAPVNTCYLFGTTTDAGKIFNRSELEDMVASRIFLDIMPGVGVPMSAARADIKQLPTYYNPDRLQRRAKTFFATGCSIIEFPAPRIMNALASGFAAYCADYLLYRNAVGFDSMKKEKKRFIDDTDLDENKMQGILEIHDNRTISSLMEDDRKNWFIDLKSKIGDKSLNPDDKYTEIENVINKAEEAVNVYTRIIDTKMDNTWRRIKPEIENVIIDHVMDSTKGPAHTIGFMTEIINRLSNEKSNCQQKRETADRESRRYLADKVDARKRKSKEDRGYIWALKRHVSWLCNNELASYMEAAKRNSLYSSIETLISRVIDNLKRKKRDIEGTYKPNLVDMKNDFISKMIDTCENLVSEADGDGFLKDLRTPLTNIIRNEGNVDNFYMLVRELLSRYNIPDMFDGDIRAKAKAVIEDMSRDDQGRVQLGRIYNSVVNSHKRFQEKLFQKCREKFNSISTINICELLKDNLMQNERDNLFTEKAKDAKFPLVVFTNDETIDHDPRTCEKSWVGVEESVDLRSDKIWDGYLSLYDGSNKKIPALREPYRMVFATEIGVFCLRNIPFLEDYKQQNISYDKQVAHINYQIEYPDIMPLDPAVHSIHLRVEEADLLGRILGIIEQGEDPQTHYEAIYYHYADPGTGTRFTEKLCNSLLEVGDSLKQQQIEKEIENRFTGTTGLERIEKEIRSIAERKVTKEEKVSFWQKTEECLVKRREEIDGDDPEKHPAYQKDLKIINSFRQRYNLHSA